MNGIFHLGDVVFGNWTLISELGTGSYGTVYEAQRRDDYGVYKSAVKIITIPKNQNEITAVRAMGMDEASATAYFKSFVDRVAQEFALMARLQGNTNIVGYLDHQAINHTNGLGWDVIIRMELLTPLLKHTIDHKMRHSDVVKLGIDICKALEVCQRQNIIHRDIKPENIFISDLGDYKLGDFGIARSLEATSGATKAGTYNYMAPEIYKESPYNMTVDIYSLGIVLYQMLNNGRIPFLPPYPTPIRYTDNDEALRLRMSGEKILPLQNVGSDLSKIVLKACAYNPHDRYSKPDQMRIELEEVLRSMPLVDSSEGSASRPIEGTTHMAKDHHESQNADGGTVGMFGNRAAPKPQNADGGTVGMFGNRAAPKPQNADGGTVGMFGNRAAPKPQNADGGTVGMFGNRAAPKPQGADGGTVGMFGNRAAPKPQGADSGTVGMFSDRAAPKPQGANSGTVGMYGERKTSANERGGAEQESGKDGVLNGAPAHEIQLKYVALALIAVTGIVSMIATSSMFGGERNEAKAPLSSEDEEVEIMQPSFAEEASQSDKEETVEWADKVVRDSVAIMLGIDNPESITKGDMEELEELNLEADGEVKSLKDLDMLSNLKVLRLKGHPISAAQSPTDLSQLTNFSASGCGMDSVDFLSSWKAESLTSINLSGNNLSNLVPISELKKLTYLDLSENQITDITPLSELKHLKFLNISGNPIQSLDALAELDELETLKATNTEIQDWSAVERLSNVEGRPIRVTEIQLSTNGVAMTVGETTQIEAAVLPDDAEDRSLWWESDNPNVASVNQSGVVSAKKAGSTVVRAYADEGSVTASCAVSVKAKEKTGNPTSTQKTQKQTKEQKQQMEEKPAEATVTLKISKSSMTLQRGAVAKLSVTPSEASPAWSSSDPSVASVSSGGTVSAYNTGIAKIVATWNGSSVSCVVTVTD